MRAVGAAEQPTPEPESQFHQVNRGPEAPPVQCINHHMRSPSRFSASFELVVVAVGVVGTFVAVVLVDEDAFLHRGQVEGDHFGWLKPAEPFSITCRDPLVG